MLSPAPDSLARSVPLIRLARAALGGDAFPPPARSLALRCHSALLQQRPQCFDAAALRPDGRPARHRVPLAASAHDRRRLGHRQADEVDALDREALPPGQLVQRLFDVDPAGRGVGARCGVPLVAQRADGPGAAAGLAGLVGGDRQQPGRRPRRASNWRRFTQARASTSCTTSSRSADGASRATRFDSERRCGRTHAPNPAGSSGAAWPLARPGSLAVTVTPCTTPAGPARLGVPPGGSSRVSRVPHTAPGDNKVPLHHYITRGSWRRRRCGWCPRRSR